MISDQKQALGLKVDASGNMYVLKLITWIDALVEIWQYSIHHDLVVFETGLEH